MDENEGARPDGGAAALAATPATSENPSAPAPAPAPSPAPGVRRYPRVASALTGEPWAIVPSELHKIAAIVSRHSIDAGKQNGPPAYIKRDYEVMAGPSAQRLPGASRAFLIDGVAILPITGPIFPRANMMTEFSGATSISTLTDDYRKALESPDVGAILLMLDSPGGAVSGVNAFADIVSAGKKKKFTTAFVAGAAASAAYWIASAASDIAMERTAMVGSIGVVAAIPAQVSPNADGELWIEIVSSNAPKKRPDPLSEDGRGEVVSMLDAIEAQFIADIARGRAVSVDKVKSEFGQGGVMIGAAAVKAGMADKVQSYDATLAGLRRMVANNRKLSALKRA